MERFKWALILAILFTIGLALSGAALFLIAPIALLMIFIFICVADITITTTDNEHKGDR